MKLKLFYILLPVVLLFNGCLNYYQETTLKTDGSGEMFIHYWMRSITPQDSVISSQFGIFSPDSIKAQFHSAYSDVSDIEVYNDGTDSTIHAKVELTFNNIDSLSQTKAFKDARFSLKDGAAGQKVFSQFITPAATGFGVDGSSFIITYIYYVPGDIITHNAHEKSNNKLTWNYTLADIGAGKTITATYRPFKLKETPIWIYGLAIFVLCIVVFFLFKKNKS